MCVCVCVCVCACARSFNTQFTNSLCINYYSSEPMEQYMLRFRRQHERVPWSS